MKTPGHLVSFGGEEYWYDWETAVLRARVMAWQTGRRHRVKAFDYPGRRQGVWRVAEVGA